MHTIPNEHLQRTSNRRPKMYKENGVAVIWVGMYSLVLFFIGRFFFRMLNFHPTAHHLLFTVVVLISALAVVSIAATLLARRLADRRKHLQAKDTQRSSARFLRMAMGLSILFIFSMGSLLVFLLIWLGWIELNVILPTEFPSILRTLLSFSIFAIGFFTAVISWGYLTSKLVRAWELHFFRVVR